MKRWYFIIDVSKCMDCNNCFIACKDEHEGNDWPGYTEAQPRHGHRWLSIERRERGQYPLIGVAYRPTPCQHCEDASCVRVSQGAIVKRPDGIVIIDQQKARGKKELVDSCPYGAIFWNEEKQVPQKCTFCAHLLDSGWQQPRCVQACFTGALRTVFLEDDDMAGLVKEEHLCQLHPEFGSRPQVYYKNLYLFRDEFIAGSVATEENGRVDCVAKATVRLNRKGEKLAEDVTDEFGDFKFDNLPADSGEYVLEIERKGYLSRSLTVSMTLSVSLGTIALCRQ